MKAFPSLLNESLIGNSLLKASNVKKRQLYHKKLQLVFHAVGL